MRELRNSACLLADRGWYVLPIKPRSKAPLALLAPRGKDSASSDLVTVLKWWQRAPDANVGLVCHPSGLVILDVDERNGGFDSLAELEGELGKLPTTASVVSGGGGAHLYFQHPGGELRGTIGEGIDIKSHGYCLVPPSIHDSGRRYVWDNDVAEVAVAELPDRWLDALKYGESRQVSPRPPDQDHPDPLRRIPAAEYVARLTGRELQRGGVFTCPFHADGQEWEPSLKVDQSLWVCYGCPPILGKRALGGTAYDFAGLLWGYAVPLRGEDYLIVNERLRRLFHV